MRRLTLVISTVCMFILGLPVIGCGGPHASAEGKPSQPAPPARSKTELEKVTPPARVVLAYLEVQKSLAADSHVTAKQRFATLATAAKDKAAVASDAIRTKLADAAKAGAASADIAAARKAFDAASRAMLEWLSVEPNASGQTLHVANCPMAFETGAKWLQLGEKIANPYFGAEMLRCGTIDAQVPAGAKLPAK